MVIHTTRYKQNSFIMKPIVNRKIEMRTLTLRWTEKLQRISIWLNTFILLASFFSANASADEIQDQVADLRKGLNQEQILLINTIGPEASRELPQEYINRLRQELRNAVLQELSKQGSSDLDIAVKKAALRYKQRVINAFEAAYGDSNGIRTTRLNVLSLQELEKSEEVLKKQLRVLLKNSNSSPEATISQSLLGRIADVKYELQALQDEKGMRNLKLIPNLVKLSNKISNQEAAELVKRIEKQPDAFAEKDLLVEVEKRKAWNVSDASLLHVEKELRSERGKSILAVVRSDPYLGWPPSRGPPPGSPSPSGGGPKPSGLNPSGGANALLTEIHLSVFDSVDWTKLSDPINRADVDARLSVNTKIIAKYLGLETYEPAFKIGLRVIDSSELNSLETKLIDWKKSLTLALAKSPDNLQVISDIANTDKKLEYLKNEMKIRGIRGPPFPTTGPHGTEDVRFQLSMLESITDIHSDLYLKELEIERNRLVNLKIELDNSTKATNPAVLTAYREQQKILLELESSVIQQHWKRTKNLEKMILIEGRGYVSLEAARYVREAKQLLLIQSSKVRRQASLLVGNEIISVVHSDKIKESLPSGNVSVNNDSLRVEDFKEVELYLRKAESLRTKRSIHFPKGNVQASNIDQIPKSLNFDKVFTREWINSAKGFKSDPYSAPGGVIIDVSLSGVLQNKIEDIRYDTVEQKFYINVDKNWKKVSPTIPPKIARVAAAFVKNERVVAVDIRPLLSADFFWLAKNNLIDIDFDAIQIGSEYERQKLVNALTYLNYIRLNPAIANSAVSDSLIAADELIFRFLKLGGNLYASDSVIRGIKVQELFELRKKEVKNLPNDSMNNSSYKSLITIEQINHVLTKDEIIFTSEINYQVYLVPHLLGSVSAWFSDHNDEIVAKSGELQTLILFATSVAILKTADHKELDTIFEELTLVIDDALPTPRFTCRSKLKGICSSDFISTFTNPNKELTP